MTDRKVLQYRENRIQVNVNTKMWRRRYVKRFGKKKPKLPWL